MSKIQTCRPLRWTLEDAAFEFEVTERTLTARLKKARVLPTDGTYSTHELVNALYDETTKNRARLYHAQALRIESLNKARSGEVYTRKEIEGFLLRLGAQLRRVLKGLDAPPDQLGEVFSALETLKIESVPAARLKERERKYG